MVIQLLIGVSVMIVSVMKAGSQSVEVGIILIKVIDNDLDELEVDL